MNKKVFNYMRMHGMEYFKNSSILPWQLDCCSWRHCDSSKSQEPLTQRHRATSLKISILSNNTVRNLKTHNHALGGNRSLSVQSTNPQPGFPIEWVVSRSKFKMFVLNFYSALLHIPSTVTLSPHRSYTALVSRGHELLAKPFDITHNWHLAACWTMSAQA
jgi:hypothetical protein